MRVADWGAFVALLLLQSWVSPAPTAKALTLSSGRSGKFLALDSKSKQAPVFLPACTCACCRAALLPNDSNADAFKAANRLQCGPPSQNSGNQCVDQCKANDSIMRFAKSEVVEYSLYCYYECQAPCGAAAGTTSCNVLKAEQVASAITIGGNGQLVTPEPC